MTTADNLKGWAIFLAMVLAAALAPEDLPIEKPEPTVKPAGFVVCTPAARREPGEVPFRGLL